MSAGRGHVPQWLDLAAPTKAGTVRSLPLRDDIQIPVQEQLIVELYSK
jgi:small subunit ribosomal protein S4